MRKDLLEDQMRPLLAAWIGSMAGSVVFAIVWFCVALLARFDFGAWLLVAVVIGAIVGAWLGWRFPQTVRAIGSVFLSLLP